MEASRHLLGELRGLLATSPSFERDVALCELMAFHSRTTLEQQGVWEYLCAESRRGKLGAVWDDATWFDVREGRLWGKAKEGVIDLRGTTPLKMQVLDELIASTHEVPCVSLDLSYLGEQLVDVLTEFVARADLSRLVWLQLSSHAKVIGLEQILACAELPRLKSLELSGAGVLDLTRCSCAGQLVHLGVSRNEIDDVWMRQHITPDVMPALRSLDLNETRVTSSVWEQLGEQHGYEAMYALKIRGTWMTSLELEVCRWLPCLYELDTFACTLQGDLDGAVSTASLELLVDGLGHVRDLEVVCDRVSEDVQQSALSVLANASYFQRLCGLGLGGILWDQRNRDALCVSHESAHGVPFQKFALRRVEIQREVLRFAWDRWGHDWTRYPIYYETDRELWQWARLAQVRSMSISLRQSQDVDDDESWIFDSVLAMPKLERLELEHLNRIEVRVLLDMWLSSKTIANLHTLEMRDSDLELWQVERLDSTSIMGPGRWVFDGFSVEGRQALLGLFSEMFDPQCTMWRWFEWMDVSTS